MPDFLDFLDPVAADAYRRRALAGQQAGDPTNPGTGLAPEEEQSFLSHALDQSLGGVSYLGKLLDKTFGGRAVRAGANMLVGGNTDPTELLSVLPFSDSLGLTHEKNTVQGTDVLGNAGLITKGDDSWENQAAGFLSEIALDPSTYVGIGPLTKAGKAAAAGGASLAPRLSERIMAGHAGLFDVGLPFQKALTGVDRAVVGEGSDLAAGVARNFWTPVTAPAQAGALAAEKYLGGPVEKLLGVNPVTALGNLGDAAYRQGRSMFDTRVAGATSRAGQDVAENVTTKTYDTLSRAAMDRYADQIVDLDPLLKKSPDAAREAQAGLVHAAESPADRAAKLVEYQKRLEGTGMDPQAVAANMSEVTKISDEADRYARLSGAQPRWARDFTPDEQLVLGKHAGDAAAVMENMRNVEKAMGVTSPDLFDILEYYPRQKAAVPQQAGETFWQYAKRATADFNARHDFQARRLEPFHDIPGGTVQLNDLIKDPRFSGPNATLAGTPLQVEDELARTLTGQGIAQHAPDGLVSRKVKDLASTLKSMDPIYAKEGRDFFDLDFAGNQLRRSEGHARTVAAAEGAYAGIAKYAKPAAAMPDGAKVTEVLERIGLTAKDGSNSAPTSWNIVARRMGLANLNDVKDLRIPTDLAADLVTMGTAWKDPAILKPVLQAWDMMANLFKTGVTTIFPAFHARNMASSLYNTFRDGALSADLKELREASGVIRGNFLSPGVAGKLYPGATPEQATKNLLKELVAGKVSLSNKTRRVGETLGANADDLSYRLPDFAKPQTFLGRAGEIAGTAKPSGQFKGAQSVWKEYLSPAGVQGVGGAEDVNRLVKTGRAVGAEIEDTIRTGHYLAKRLQGLSPVEAAQQVAKYHINYSRATPFERGVMRRIYPWYSFSAGNLPPLLEDLATNPGRITAATRLVGGVRDPGQFVPSYIGEGASIPIPGAPDGQQRYISSFGLGIEDEAIKTIGSLLKGDVRRTLQQGIGQANPLVKLPFEQAFGTQLFSGRKLDDLKPSTTVSLGGLLPDDLARGLTELVANSPASRAVHTVDTFLDPRKDVGATLINLGTGVRLTDIDTARQQDIAARQLVKDELRGTAGIRTREEVYAPVAERGNLDPTQRFLLELLKSTDKKVQDRAAMEKAQGGR